ncbi:hypothetical protein [Edwardsiella tarda]|uniref:hypothetical protein n=1 Tax=Edwardsiella tarda TaxID=636 RepID=UPI00054EA142|nr:hypothetical protein [Edwardsiella tarda]
MSNLRDEVINFDLDQLRSLQNFVVELISRKEDEPRKTVWRVCSGGVCYGNFREEEYLKAVALLLEMAKKIDENPDSDRRDRHIDVSSIRVVESEYESWFQG